ncbi:metal ABC transporter substrate-binding protein [Halobacteriovorax sp. GFR7]|uniref:metal ABC transporter substrate-binding protein n=1 Tax=unclassified Halobacteriovorax TaxID=2639665 RepID=UPI003712E077
MNSRIITIIFLIFSFNTMAKLKVLTTTTDIAWLAQKIGGEKVEVESLLNGTEDPHFMDAMPHFIAKAANADIFCMVGLDLEVGWAPKILTRSGNKNIQPGGKGFCETGKTVKAIDIPTGKIDRSHGDVHPQGNPHYHLGPTAYLQGAETVLNVLIDMDSKNATYYMNNFESTKKHVNNLKNKISNQLKGMKGLRFMEYHREFSYFLKEFGIVNTGAIESVPGVPPSAGRLARVAIEAKQKSVALALAAKTSPKGLTDKFQEMSGVHVSRVPISIEKKGQVRTYDELLSNIANDILKNAKKK